MTKGWIIGVAAWLCVHGGLVAQTDGLVPYHQLTRADFRINDRLVPATPDDGTAPSAAENAMVISCFCEGSYEGETVREVDGRISARVTQWTVLSGIDRNQSARKSWVKFPERLLTHEQGHLDINELHSRALANVPLSELPTGQGRTEAEATADLEAKLAALQAQTARTIDAEQAAYDIRTEHGTNDREQARASAAIAVRLKRAGIRY